MSERQDTSYMLQVSNLIKTFGNFVANDHINFILKRGEIHCLLGENGAGKSTFAKCLYGAYRHDSGKVVVNGKEVHFSSPKAAIQHRIGMVHQHFVLVPTMTVVENIVVGVDKPGISTGLREAAEKVNELCEKFGVELDPHAVVSNLAVGQQQWVEILKALFSGVEILILDEPTASLTPQESEQLFSIIKQMTLDGTSVIFITHKLNEVMMVSDRTTIFRKGKIVGTVETASTNRMELATLMVGRGVHFEVDKQDLDQGEPIMEIRDLSALGKNNRESLKSVNLTIHQNEILGIAGVGGNGQAELFDVIFGIQQASIGKIIVNGKDITSLNPTKILDTGLASIPSDRMTQGLLLDFSVAENLMLGSQWKAPFMSRLILREKQVLENAINLIDEYEIATSGPEQVAARLSGGNLQKLILARELSRKISCVVANCPTRGLDVGAIEYVHRRLVELRDEGIGVMLISEDLDEIFNVSDRIAVFFQGRIMGEFKTNQTSREQIGLLMAGVTESAS